MSAEDIRAAMLRSQHSARALQERADNALSPWGIRAPAPVLGQTYDEYRRKLAIMCKRQLPDKHELRRVQVRQLSADALAVFEPQIYDACKSAAYNADSVPDGQMRRVEEIDGNGLKIVKFIGQHSFVRDFTTRGRLARIRTPENSPGWFR
jgi:hypothetical protein